MCYEYGSYFWKTRAKELNKARELADQAKRTTPEAPAKAPERPREEIKTPEQVPA